MAEIDVGHVELRPTRRWWRGRFRREWYALSIGINGEPLARSTDSYPDIRNAEAVAYTMSAGASVERRP